MVTEPERFQFAAVIVAPAGGQTTYYLKKPIALPKGTRLEVKAHFDNSPRNPTNPDPAKAVRWGDPTYDEMMIGWIDYYRDGRAPVTASSGR